MTHDFFDDDHEVRKALQDLFRDRHENVDWTALNERIIAAAERRAAPPDPVDVLAAWSGRAAVTSASLIAAGLAALLFLSGSARDDAAPPGFWPVAEELLATLPADTRRIIAAGSEPRELLELIAADVREEVDRR